MRESRLSRLPLAVRCFSLVLGLSLALAPAMAAATDNAAPQQSPDSGSPGELAREGLEQMMRALRLLVESIPQYELPEVLDNGDIIIRRKHGEDAPAREPEIDETAT